MFTRIALFMATNVAVLLMITIVFNVLGFDSIQTSSGTINLMPLLVMSLIIGFGGSFISLAMSKWMAKRATRAHVIDQPRNATESWLLATVQQQAQKAGIGTPEVAIYDSPDMNAFATGMRRDDALVAVSTGLLRSMPQDEVEAVLAHEVAHVANGDMVTLALVQGVVNTFVVFLSRIVGMIVDSMLSRGENNSGLGMGYFLTSMVAQIVFGILATPIVMWVSRKREFRADAGSASLNGKEPMIRALARLERGIPAELPESLEAFGISGGKRQGIQKLFMSHPPIQERIAALQNA